MGKLVVVIVLLAFTAQAPGRQTVPGKMLYAFPASGSDLNRLHSSGNEFAKRVGILLKDRFPARVEDVNVRLTFRKDRLGKERFFLIWSCVISPSTPSEADYHFDRRGTIRTDRGTAAAETQSKAQSAMLEFKRKFGNVRDLGTVAPSATDSTGQAWYLAEHFYTARK